MNYYKHGLFFVMFKVSYNNNIKHYKIRKTWSNSGNLKLHQGDVSVTFITQRLCNKVFFRFFDGCSFILVSVVSRVNDVSETFPIMAAEGCEEMSGNGELEESSGSESSIYECAMRRFLVSQIFMSIGFICKYLK